MTPTGTGAGGTDAGLARRGPRTTVVLAGLLIVGTGCSSASFDAASPPDRWVVGGRSVEHLSDGTAFLVSGPGSGDKGAAIVEGTLAVVGGGCVGFNRPDGPGSVVLALPHGSRPTGDGTAIEIPGGPTVRIGDGVRGGGGYRDLTVEDGVVASGWPDAPEACLSAPTLAGISDVEKADG